MVDLAFSPNFKLRAVIKHHGWGDAKEEFAKHNDKAVAYGAALQAGILSSEGGQDL